MAIMLKLIVFLALLYESLQWCLLKTYYELAGNQINEVDWSPDGNFIVTGSGSKRVTVISFATSNVVFFQTFSTNVNTAKFNRKGNLLAIGRQGDDTIKIYNVPLFTVNSSFRAGHGNTATIFQLDFSHDDVDMVTCGSDGYVNQRRLSTSAVTPILVVSGQNIIACKYNSINRIGASSNDGKIYSIRNGGVHRTQSHNLALDLDFRPDSDKMMYVGCTCDKKLYSYDLNSNNRADYINLNEDNIYAVSFAPDSTFVATGDKDGWFTIINTVGGPNVQAKVKPKGKDIFSVRVSDNSNFVAVGYEDGVILIYSRYCSATCQIGYYYSSSGCRMCSLAISSCALCDNSTVCLSCYPQYYLTAAGSCTICHTTLDGCSTCRNSSVCLTCVQTYYLSGNTCSKCQTLTPYCSRCISNGTCIGCSLHYYLTASNTCSDCKNLIANCISCYFQTNTSSSTNTTLYCAQCSKGYYALQSQCLPCSNNCDRCISTGDCIACAQQYRLNGTSCIKCNQYCEACYENGTCLDCIPTTFLSSGSCSLCTFPCLTCTTSTTTCVTCALGYYLSATGICSKCVGCPLCNPYNGSCLSCPEGQYLQNPSNTCANCLNTTSNCAICSASACLACQRNYYLTGSNVCARTVTISQCLIYQKFSTTVCSHCNLGFYLDSINGTCLQCLSGCINCDNSNNCTQCQLGFYMESSNATCMSCQGFCKTCNSSSSCLSCGDQYYLSGTTCQACWIGITNCNSCLDSTLCLDCRIGYNLSANSSSCLACVSPCSTCNSAGCLSCEPGYFYLSNNCIRCPGTCTSCSSLSVCTTCVSGYALNSSNMCVSCDILFLNCLYCTNSVCTVCKHYFMLNVTSNTCTNCANNISNCLNCDNNGLCNRCRVGFYPALNKLSCTNCTVSMLYCESCVNGTVCDYCLYGYYLSATNQCSRCMTGCLTCIASGNCTLCEAGFIKTAGNLCQDCNQYIFGCELCSLSLGCSACQLGYYKVSSTNCTLCKIAMPGCLACNSSSICISCDAGYFLNSTNKCQICSSTVGCGICNTAACLECLTGYYLNSTYQCQLCSNLSSDCTVCNSTSCLQCDTGAFLTNNTCLSCTNYNLACQVCNGTRCLQCQTGYYLQSNSNCQVCSIVGCQLCSPTGTNCLSCQNLYYKNGATCSLCQSMDFGCLACSALNSCLICKTGYYLNSNGTCMLCDQRFPGCDVCDSGKCLTCKTNYFYNRTSAAGDCIICKDFLPGCSLCINQAQCLLCQSGHFLQGIQCSSCTSINQCLVCQDANTCLFCGAGYYLNGRQCLSCSAAITGCFSCITSTVCETCSGSYTMSSGICVQVKAVIPQNYTNLRIVSEYINATYLKHSLYSTGISFRQIQQDWSKVTKLQLIMPPNNKTFLTILSVEWGKVSNFLIFYTNNPFGEASNSAKNNMPFLGNFSSKRLLFNLQDLNMQISFQMQKAAINQILPELDTSGQNLALQYKISNPQFYRSILKDEKYNFYLIGIAITSLLIVGYFIKICCVIPMTNDTGEIIPHILLLKVPAMVIYPSLGGYINYCYGFTYIDLPWLNDFFSSILSNLSDESPAPFKMFYKNLSMASTYLLALSAFLAVFVPLTIYSIYKDYKTKRVDKLPVQRNRDQKAIMQNISILQKPVDRIEQFRSYLYNIFMTGLVVSSFACMVGISYNPTTVILKEGVFYVLGIIVYTLVLIDAVRSFLDSKHKFNKIRVLIKGSLMTLLFWSPVPLFSVIIVVDGAIMAYQYKLKLKQWVVPKVWILTHVLLLISYGCLIFLSNMSLGIILATVMTVSAMLLDCYLQYAEHLQVQKIKDLRSRQKQYTQNNLSIEGFIPDKRQRISNSFFEEIKSFQITKLQEYMHAIGKKKHNLQ